jgi:probable rRNA maturation factor
VDPDSSRLHIAVTDGRGRPVRAPGLRQWLASVAPARARGVVAIALASDAQVRALNRRYRRKDQPTDVLSFPAEGGPVRLKADVVQLGDLVIATGVAQRQAAEAGHSYATELKVLALHGLLHLLGYDHHAADDRGRMARVEARLRRRGGLRTGLIERASQPVPPVGRKQVPDGHTGRATGHAGMELKRAKASNHQRPRAHK